jgi:hypothetical protein
MAKSAAPELPLKVWHIHSIEHLFYLTNAHSRIYQTGWQKITLVI